jgi:hypothetical protein
MIAFLAALYFAFFAQPASGNVGRNAEPVPYTIIDLKWPPASERAQEPFQGIILKPRPDTPSFVLTFGFPVITLSHQDDLRTMLRNGGPYMAFHLTEEDKWTRCSLEHWRNADARPLLIPRLHTDSVEAKRRSARDALRAIAAALPCEIQDNDGMTLDWCPDGRFAAIVGFTRNKDDSRNNGDEKDFVTLYALIHDTQTSKNYICTLSSSTQIFAVTGGWPEDSSVYAVLNWVPFTQSVYFVSPPPDLAPDAAQPTAPNEPSKENKP